jgi:hypothetical protein
VASLAREEKDVPTDLTTTREEKDTAAPNRLPPCPCCAGVLIVLRGTFRCTRCQYSLCAGCEAFGPEAED